MMPKPGPQAAAGSIGQAGGSGYVVVTGNPNCGKTTLFNALTGLRAKVGNYPGVTVERKEGRMQSAPAGRPVTILDLPGCYSLSPHSLDEQIARDVLFHRLPEVPTPDLVVVVTDASSLQRSLYFATQVIELGYPTILALNMIDVARKNGHEVDALGLAEKLGVPVLPVVASSGEGIPALREAIFQVLRGRRQAVSGRSFCELGDALAREVKAVAALLLSPLTPQGSLVEALLLLSDDRFLQLSSSGHTPDLSATVRAARGRLEREGIDWQSAAIEARYACISAIYHSVTTETALDSETLSDRLDRVLTHKIWGLLVFVGVLAVIFQSIFFLAQVPMKGLEHGAQWLGGIVDQFMPPGALHSLLVDGVISGVGAVVVFLPQICLLFLFLGLLEDTGYMARAAFLMDRVMSKVGLHGRSFIPMLSSFACAIPGIMATRTIEGTRDRLVTILIAPLMSCSARLPVYTVLIAACIPDRKVLGVVKLPGLVLLAMYLLGIGAALGMAWIFKRTLLKGPAPMLIMELPAYRRPLLRTLARHVWDRARLFLTQAGTLILAINILLWFLVTYPHSPTVRAQYRGPPRGGDGLGRPRPTGNPDRGIAAAGRRGKGGSAATQLRRPIRPAPGALHRAAGF